MKKIIFLLCVLPIVASAQITYNDTLNHVNGLIYAGVLSGPAISKDGTSTGTFYFRTGGTIMWSPVNYLSVFVLAGGETDHTNKTTSFTHLNVRLKPVKSVLITLGKTSSVMTELLRPLPVTGAGQFETWTQSHIPGPAVGGKIAFSPNDKFSLLAGSFWRGKEASSEIGMHYGAFDIAGYYLNHSGLFGGAFDVKLKKFMTTFSYNHKQNVSMLDIVELPWFNKFSVYSDVGFGLDSINKKMIRGEWGFFKKASYKYLGLLIGVGYAEETKTVNGYLFIHL